MVGTHTRYLLQGALVKLLCISEISNLVRYLVTECSAFVEMAAGGGGASTFDLDGWLYLPVGSVWWVLSSW